MKKKSSKDISITHVSEKTIIKINGKEVSMGGLNNDQELMSLLMNNNLDASLISELMQASTTSNNQTTNENTTSNKFSKVECSSCNRTVSFGKGTCMYCGNALELKITEQKSKPTNSVDEKYLNTEKIESKNEVSDADLNYIDRLKDI